MEEANSDFGADFNVVDCEQPKYVSDGSRYWLQDSQGEWVYMNSEQFKRHLKSAGKSTATVPGSTLTGIELEMHRADLEFRIKWAGPLAGHWSGFKSIAGNKVLVTQDPVLVDPIQPPEDAMELPEEERHEVFGVARGWPTLARVIRNLLSCEMEGERQVEVYLSYLRHTLDCLYGKFWDKAPTLAIAGEVKCGKSLIIEVMRELFAKRVGKPYDWFIGRENFNADLLECVLLVIDDEVSDTNPKSRALLGDRCKNIAASAGGIQRIRGMHKEGIALQPLWRPVIAVNDTPDKLMVLPPIEEDNFDKMILLKAYRKPLPMPADTPEERTEFWNTLMAELPHFAWWLMNAFSIPRELRGRFGVTHYHHPEVVKGLSELSNEMQLWHYLEKTVFGSSIMNANLLGDGTLSAGEWMGTSSDLYSYLTTTNDNDSGRRCLNTLEAQSIPKPNWLGQRLARLEKMYPKSVTMHRTAKARIWHLVPPEEFREDEKEAIE